MIPRIFGREPPDRRITELPVRYGGLGLRDPTMTAQKNHLASKEMASYLVDSILRNSKFDTRIHKNGVYKERKEMKEMEDQLCASKLEEIMTEVDLEEKVRLNRALKNGAWLTINPRESNESHLSAGEFRDGLFVRYGLHPSRLQGRCDGCGAKTNLKHAMSCAKGGLIIGRHNEIRDEVGNLLIKAFSSSSVRGEPIIQHGLGVEVESGDEDLSPSNERGDILVRGLLERGMESVIDVRVVNAEASSYCRRDIESVLEGAENQKKKKYHNMCMANRKSFIPFVCSSDGVIGDEGQRILKIISKRLARKWKRSFSETCGFFRARMGIAINRTIHHCLRSSRVPMRRISSPWVHWEDGLGLYVYNYVENPQETEPSKVWN